MNIMDAWTDCQEKLRALAQSSRAPKETQNAQIAAAESAIKQYGNARGVQLADLEARKGELDKRQGELDKRGAGSTSGRASSTGGRASSTSGGASSTSGRASSTGVSLRLRAKRASSPNGQRSSMRGRNS